MTFSGRVMGNDLATFDLFGYTAKKYGGYNKLMEMAMKRENKLMEGKW
jgi:hypothetical protein